MIFEENDVAVITDCILKKLKKVIENLAPARKIQIRKNDNEANSGEIQKLLEEAPSEKLKAIESKNIDNFSKANYLAELDKIKKNLSNPTYKWQKIDDSDFIDKLLMAIMVKGKLVTSQKALASTLTDNF